MGHDYVHEQRAAGTRLGARVDGGKYTREQLINATSLVVARLLHRAIEEGADPDSDVWIGVPVTASTCTRKRLLCALEQARRPNGARLFADFADVLRRVHFVLEPLAVVAAAGEDLEIRGRQNVLVFDHGGGTLDLSLVSLRASVATGWRPSRSRSWLPAAQAMSRVGRSTPPSSRSCAAIRRWPQHWERWTSTCATRRSSTAR